MTEQQTTFDRVATDESKTTLPNDVQPNDDVLVADIQGWDQSKGVTLTLSHPLNQKDRDYLGLPGGERSTEVGQRVRVNKNGAKALIGAGYATVDPEDDKAVTAALTGTDAASGTVSTDADQPTTQTGTPVAVEPGLDKSEPAGPPAGEGDVPAEGEEKSPEPVDQTESGPEDGPTPSAPSGFSGTSDKAGKPRRP